MNSADPRTQILYGVWQVIATDGIAGVSMRSVAAAAGVSVGSVQHHFGSKQALIRASAAAMLQSAEDHFQADAKDIDAEARLWALVGHSIPLAEASRTGVSVFYAYVAASVADPAIANLLADAKRGVLGELATLLDELHVAAPADRAVQLLALGDGLAMNVLLGTLDAERAATALASEIKRVLQPADLVGD